MSQKSLCLDNVNFGLGFTGAALIILGSNLTNDRYDAVLSGKTETTGTLVSSYQQNLGKCSFAAPFDFLASKGSSKPRYDVNTGQLKSTSVSGTGLKIYEGFGFALFIIGWILVTIAAATYYKPKSNGGREMTWNNAMGPTIVALSIATCASTGMAWYYMSTNHSTIAKVGIYSFTVASWIGLAIAIANKKGYFDLDRFILAFVGVFCILMSMWNLSYNRRFQGLGQSPNLCPNVYNIGMPLFVLGWMLLIVSFTME